MRDQAPEPFPDPVKGVLDTCPRPGAGRCPGGAPEAVLGGGRDVTLQRGQLGHRGERQAGWLAGPVTGEGAPGGGELPRRGLQGRGT